MSLIPVLNKTSPQVHTKLELDVLGVHGKLVKYIVHLSKKNWKKIIFLHTSCPNNNWPVFGLQGILGVKTCCCPTMTSQFCIGKLYCCPTMTSQFCTGKLYCCPTCCVVMQVGYRFPSINLIKYLSAIGTIWYSSAIVRVLLGPGGHAYQHLKT
jgi:hypothetical protein